MTRSQGHILNFPSLMGAYLAVNAIQDAAILVDGPDCALYKAHFIFGRHDLQSTLLDINGFHRVCFTNISAQDVTKEHNEPILRKLKLLDAGGDLGLLLLTALPGCSITGIDYEHLLRMVAPVLKKPAIAIPPISLMGDWLDGYAVTLRALARHVDLRGARPAPTKAAIVGYLMDRNEGDHRGNLRELRRILAVLGLDLVSVWLGGETYGTLRRVKEAGLIISLPYAREAAREIAGRTGAKIVETELPFGLGATERWVRQIAEAAGKMDEARRMILEERAKAMDRLEWIIPHLFLHRTAAYVGDPFLMDGCMEICGDLGIHLKMCLAMGREGRTTSRPDGPEVVHAPDIYHPLAQQLIERAPDMVIANTNDIVDIIQRERLAIVELGFPSYFHHAFTDAPFLGFEGFLAFVGRMADALSSVRREAMRESKRGCLTRMLASPSGRE